MQLSREESLRQARARETAVRVNGSLLASNFQSSTKPVEFFLDVQSPGQDVEFAVKAAGLSAPGVHFVGELAMNGEIRETRDITDLPRDKVLVVPWSQRNLVSHFNPGQTILGFHTLVQVLDFVYRFPTPLDVSTATHDFEPLPKGHLEAELATAIDVAKQGKNIWLNCNAPGVGAAMLARRIVQGLGPMSYEESVNLSRTYAAAGIEAKERTVLRSFRAPHHTVSEQGLLGNKQHPYGEISLARYGVLLLDEADEFRRSALGLLCDEVRRRQDTVVVLVSYPTYGAPRKHRELDPQELARWNAVEIKLTR
jgi:predicted ATPase with chaperone activity